MTTTPTKDRKTPGVYITEFDAFAPSVVGVATAVPIFVGYTQTAKDPGSNASMYQQAVPISSMADYYDYFGYGYAPQAEVTPQTADLSQTGSADHDFEAPSARGGFTAASGFACTTAPYRVGAAKDSSGPLNTFAQFNLFSAMQLFYANGGGNCFVISVGNYWGTQSVTPTPTDDPIRVNKEDLLAGLTVARNTRGVTMLLVPDACLLVDTETVEGVTSYRYPDYQAVALEMLTQAGELQDRVAIFDLPGALQPANWTCAGMEEQARQFSELIGSASPYFSYGACYGPALESSILGPGDLRYSNLTGTQESATLLNNLLTTQALQLYPPVADLADPAKVHYSAEFVEVAARIGAAFPVPLEEVSATASAPAQVTANCIADNLLLSMGNPAIFSAPTEPSGIKILDQYLENATPLLSQIKKILADKLNVVPPCGPMAGIWTFNDATRGVWNAPANLELNEIVAPKVLINDEQQGGFNAPSNGIAIDVLRAMVNRGMVVWGARTLDGNSPDYRYIETRRTLIYIEQSIKNELQPFVFAPNDAQTWTAVTALISNFLTQLWQAGGLEGSSASEAFTVDCGVPVTMSGEDVLNGLMIVDVKVQLNHPAEFIELSFKQTMPGT